MRSHHWLGCEGSCCRLKQLTLSPAGNGAAGAVLSPLCRHGVHHLSRGRPCTCRLVGRFDSIADAARDELLWPTPGPFTPHMYVHVEGGVIGAGGCIVRQQDRQAKCRRRQLDVVEQHEDVRVSVARACLELGGGETEPSSSLETPNLPRDLVTILTCHLLHYDCMTRTHDHH